MEDGPGDAELWILVTSVVTSSITTKHSHARGLPSKKETKEAWNGQVPWWSPEQPHLILGSWRALQPSFSVSIRKWPAASRSGILSNSSPVVDVRHPERNLDLPLLPRSAPASALDEAVASREASGPALDAILMATADHEVHGIARGGDFPHLSGGLWLACCLQALWCCHVACRLVIEDQHTTQVAARHVYSTVNFLLLSR